jgi:hypothetical protein
MAITTYAQLQAAVASWLDRSDLTTEIVDFITLFEAVANRRLRVRQMETSTTLTPSSGSASLPSDYLQWRRVTWTGSVRQELEYVHPSYLQALYPDTPSDTPTVFTIEGSTLKVRPTSTTGLEFDYYQKIPALADDATTNWLLTAHPDLYLFGSLVEAQMFTVDPEQAAIWKARRDEVFDEISNLGRKSQGGGAIRVMGPTP